MTPEQELELFVKCCGEAIREMRTAKNYSQTELANRSGISRATISQCEGGKNNISIITLYALGHALDSTGGNIVGRATELYQAVLDKKGIVGHYDPRVYMKKKTR